MRLLGSAAVALIVGLPTPAEPPSGGIAQPLPFNTVPHISVPAIFLARPSSVGVTFRGKSLTADFGPAGVEFRSAGGRPIHLHFPGSQPVVPDPIEPTNTRISRPSRAGDAHELAAYGGVRYGALYPGIDLYFRTAGPALKSEFVVSRGASPRSIRLAYSAPVHVDRAGNLACDFEGSRVVEGAPVVYQEVGAKKKTVQARYQVFPDGSAGFSVGAYDEQLPLIIDPPISYSTYLGGSRFDAGTAVAADKEGNAYIAGWTESPDLPSRAGFQPRHAGSVDAFIAKVDPAGKLVYCTYLGGSADDRAFGIAVDHQGSAYVTGSTSSTDFPVRAAFRAGLRGGRDAFVAKLSPSGDELIYSTYVGGTGHDSGNGIAVDAAGEAYVAGETNSVDFPTVAPTQPVAGGLQDAFVLKLNVAGAPTFVTYLGGWADDRATAIVIDAQGSMYIAGGTSSGNFPLVAPMQSSLRGAQDAFVSKVDPAFGLIYSTYLGGNGGSPVAPETAYGIAVDADGAAHVAGTTSSPDFPVIGAFQPTYNGGGSDAFVAKVNTWGTALVYATYLGGTGADTASAIRVDTSGQAYVAGWTTSSDFPLVGETQPAKHGAYDAFLAQLTESGSGLMFSTFLGGSESDAAKAVGLAADAVYVAGQSQSNDFPVKAAQQSTDIGNFGATLTRFSQQTTTEFVPVTPCRVVDTRPDQGKTGPFGPPTLSPNSARDIPIPFSGCGIPDFAVAYSLNITVVPRGYFGHLITWPTGTPMPRVSTLNAWNGDVVANAAIVPAGIGGSVSILVSDTADVIVDVNGYFAPAEASEAITFHPVIPCRVMDTRADQGKSGPFGPPAMAGGTLRDVPIPLSGCGIPASAVAYSLNITVLPRGYFGYLITWPSGLTRPRVSTLNSWDGDLVTNAAIVPAGIAGNISILVSDTADVLVDINGYFGLDAEGKGFSFHAVRPCRVVDTRADQHKTGPFGPPVMAGGSGRELPIPASDCGIPLSAVAYSLNFTVLPRAYLGYLITWPSGLPMPRVSTLNSWDADVVANAAIVPAGTNGAIRVVVSDTTDLIIDVNGYFGP